MNKHHNESIRAFASAQLGPSLRTALWAIALFAAGLWLAHEHGAAIRELLSGQGRAGMVVFVATSIVAVLLPVLTNLPLVPAAVLAWGPWWTAGLLLAGWIAGATLSFALGRHARGWILRHLPRVTRHAGIERLIHPRHRIASLVLLRMTFPVDVLSYALGVFSPRTSTVDVAVSTAIGATPFALLFALLSILPTTVQVVVFLASTAVFAAYTTWMLRR